jgi:hypothetical protein
MELNLHSPHMNYGGEGGNVNGRCWETTLPFLCVCVCLSLSLPLSFTHARTLQTARYSIKYSASLTFQQTRYTNCIQRRPETYGRLVQANNLAPLSNRYSLKFFGLEQGWRTFFKAHAQIALNFRRNSFSRGKSEFTSTIFPIRPVTFYCPL